MKPHPRIRKTIKWGGAAVTVLFLTTWLISGYWAYHNTSSPGPWFTLCTGRLNFGVCYVFTLLPLADGWKAWPPYRIVWSLGCDSAPSGWFISIPLWPLVLTTTAITLTAFRLDTLARRRARLNLCTKCHYDRTGVPSASPCPECGTPPTP